jgi:hypothetical protein
MAILQKHLVLLLLKNKLLIKKIYLLGLIFIACSGNEATELITTTSTVVTSTSTSSTTTMGLSDEAREIIESLPVVKFEICPEENLKVGDIFPLAIYIGSSSADIKEAYVQIDDEAAGISEYSFSEGDVAKKGDVRTYSLDLEMLDYETDYTVFITAYAEDVKGNQDGKVCSFIVEKVQSNP